MPAAGVLAVNDFATAIDFAGASVVARPRAGLTAYRLPGRPPGQTPANGGFFDRWAAAIVRFQVWPESTSAQGFYRVVLSLPEPRDTVSTRSVGIQAGMCFGASFWKKWPPSIPSGYRFIVNGRSRRCGTSAGATRR